MGDQLRIGYSGSHHRPRLPLWAAVPLFLAAQAGVNGTIYWLAALPLWDRIGDSLEFVVGLELTWAAALLAVVALFWRVIDRRPWAELGLRAGTPREWLLGSFLGGMPVVLIFVVQVALGHLRVGGWATPTAAAAFQRIALFLLLGLAIGLAEELPFRGYLLPALATRFGRAIPVLLSAALFLLFHLRDSDYQSPTNMAQVLVVGIVFGWLRLATGGLTVPILAHAAWDAANFILVRGPDMEGTFHVTLGPPSPWFGDFHTAGWLDLLVLLVWTLAIWRWIYLPWLAGELRREKAEQSIPF